jgi:SAM-dependent methyltransferase
MKSNTANTSFLLRGGISVSEKNGVSIDNNWEATGVTDQFMEDADTYHERYFNRLDFVDLTGLMLDLSQVNRSEPVRVLDIGSGGGSSVFAALKLLPNATVVASDISPQLLQKLVAFSSLKPELDGRIKAFCFDLHRPFFEKNSFDVVVGCAILHHLTNPFLALKNVAYALKSGGKIVMCEPLEAGNLLNLFIYDTVIEIERLHGDPLNKRLSNLMSVMRRDLQARQGPPEEKPWTRHLDDKWIFDASYLQKLADELECSSVEVHPAQRDLSQVFTKTFYSLLGESGNSDLKLSDHVQQFLHDVDSGISAKLKQRLCPTGIIVMTK